MTVSVVIPTYNRTSLLLNRALPSVLAQTYSDLDIHVVGDGTEEATVEAMADLMEAHPRVRFTNLPHALYPDDPQARWCAIGYPALNYGIETAKGEWIAMLADDDAWPSDRIDVLLAAAGDAPFVYGRTEIVGHGLYGEWPPHAAAFTDGAAMWRASLGLRYDEQSWQRGIPADFDLRARVLASGIRMAWTPEVVYRYWPAHKIPPVYQAVA